MLQGSAPTQATQKGGNTQLRKPHLVDVVSGSAKERAERARKRKRWHRAENNTNGTCKMGFSVGPRDGSDKEEEESTGS